LGCKHVKILALVVGLLWLAHEFGMLQLLPSGLAWLPVLMVVYAAAGLLNLCGCGSCCK